MKKIGLVAALLLMVTAMSLAGCGGKGSGGKIDGINWILDTQSLGGKAESTNPSVSLDALFEGGMVSGFSGVNTYSGQYKLSGSSLTIGNIASTMMAGPKDLMDLEQQYLAALRKTKSYTADSASLTLFEGAGKELMKYSKGKATSLTGTTWNVIMYYDGRSAIVGVKSGTSMTAVFSTSGTVSGSGGVNDYTGTYKTSGRKISVTGVKATTGTTSADPAVAQQQADYFAALQMASTYKLTSGRLDLMRADGGFAVQLSSGK